MLKNNRGWKICIGIFIILTVISFTPLVIPQNVYKPEIFGIPYTLWTSFLLTFALVILTYVGMRLHPGNQDKEGKL
ncbi:MAG: hypothetical protein KAH17_08140 [Bacteroidales bacterium]|nr:hypothetical protein [Bacteroidales bacterium]